MAPLRVRRSKGNRGGVGSLALPTRPYGKDCIEDVAETVPANDGQTDEGDQQEESQHDFPSPVLHSSTVFACVMPG